MKEFLTLNLGKILMFLAFVITIFCFVYIDLVCKNNYYNKEYNKLYYEKMGVDYKSIK